MTAKEILQEIKPLGEQRYKEILSNHGVKDPCFGVKIEHLKKIQNRVKMDYQLALDLFDTGIYDAMYLAGLIADDSKMTQSDLQHWAEKAERPLNGSAVPWVAASSRYGREMALKWIDSARENIAVAGWTTLSGLVAIKDDAALDLAELKCLLQRVQKTIHEQADDVRYAMNSFVIAVGCYVKALTEPAIQTGEKIGEVSVDMGNTACKVPYSPDYIRKVQKRGTIGRKRKSTRC